MPHFSLPFEQIATGSTADVYKTMAALIVDDTQGHRIRVRGIHVYPADPNPLAHNIGVHLDRILDLSAGSAGTPGTTPDPVAKADMPHHDPGSVDSLVAGERDYTAEPTTFQTESLFVGGFHMNGGLINERFDEDEKYVCTRDMLIALRCAPRAAVTLTVSGVILFEVY